MKIILKIFISIILILLIITTYLSIIGIETDRFNNQIKDKIKSIDEKKCMVHCECRAEAEGKTGVEMEALTSVQITLLTIYDMCKAVDRGMSISDIKLLKKTGGKAGECTRH